MKEISSRGSNCIEPNQPDKNMDKICDWLYKAVDHLTPALLFIRNHNNRFATGLTKEELWDLRNYPHDLQIGSQSAKDLRSCCTPTYERGDERGVVITQLP